MKRLAHDKYTRGTLEKGYYIIKITYRFKLDI